MKRVLPSGLRQRLMLLIAFTVGASMLLVLAGSLRERRAALGAAGAEASLLARLAAAHEERALTDARRILGELSALKTIDPRRPSVARRALLAELADSPVLASLAAYTPRGRVFSATGTGPHAPDASDAPWFQRAIERRGFVVEDEPARGSEGRAWLRCAAPVIDREGRIRAVVCATLDAEWMRRAAVRARLPLETSLLVIDRRGAVIAQQPASGRADSVIAGFEAAAFREGHTFVRGGDGAVRLVAFWPLEGVRDRMLFVGVGVRRDAVLAAATRTFQRDMLLLLFVTLLISALAWRGVEVVVLRRVHALLAATARLRQGDMGARTGLPYGRGELSQLSEDFDRMAYSLQRQRAIREQAEDRLRLSEARKRAVLEASLDAIVIVDATGRLLECNRAARAIFGLAHPYTSHAVSDLIDIPRMGFADAAGVPSAGRFECDARRADGSTFAAEVSVAPIRDPEAAGLFVLTVRDISERRRWQQAVEAESHEDDLTGLLNRRGFRALANQQLGLAARENRDVVLVSVDLDGLKAINDTYGHAEGDRAIVELAAALHDSFRATDVIARLGGDEFVVFAMENEHKGAEHSLDRLAARIAARDAQLGKPWRLRASFGWIRVAPGAETRLEQLLGEADQRMYARKRRRGVSRDDIAGAGPAPKPASSPHAA